jgi:periplasmic protein TonB
MKYYIVFITSLVLCITFPSDFFAQTNTDTLVIIEEEVEEDVEEEEVFFIVEDMPQFQGGSYEKFRKYIQDQMVYPEEAVKQGIEGRVFVKFIVDRTGNVKNVEVAKHVHPLLDAEAVRIVSSSPRWTPGTCRGPGQDVQFVFPVLFELNKKEIKEDEYSDSQNRN